MPSVRLSPLFNGQTVTSAGAPASGYKVYTYAAGSSSDLATYTTSAGTVAQSNPVILDAYGFPENPIWLQTGLSYKLVLKDTNDVVIRTEDNVTGVNDTGSTASQWASASATPTYVSATSFTVPGDQTSDFHVGRRIQCTVSAGTVYGKIVDTAYTTLTTVKVLLDSGTLDSGLSVVNLGIIRADTPAIEYLANHGQCRLAKSGANLVLSPYNGNKIVIGGRIHTIPSAGVSLAPTSLSPATMYFIYAYMNAGTMTLEAAGLSYVVDANTGVAVKAGDSSRTLVGQAYCAAGPAWIDDATSIGVISYFNRKVKTAAASFSANRSTLSTSPVELNTEIRVNFLNWADTGFRATLNGGVAITTAGPGHIFIGIDGTSARDNGSGCNITGGVQVPFGASEDASTTEGVYHYATVCAQATSPGTTAMIGSGSAGGLRTSLRVAVMG